MTAAGHVRAAGDRQMRRLFELSREFRRLAPWDHAIRRPWLGVRNPDFPETAYVCIMGYDAHRPGLAAYMSDRGFHCCNGDSGDWEDPLELGQRAYHLKVLYMDRDQLRKEERQLIHRLGLKFRNRFNWPAFRSFVPGYVTWHLLSPEADFLISILEQTCLVLAGETGCLEPCEEPAMIRLRTATDTPGGDRIWTTVMSPVPAKPECPMSLKKLPGNLECCRELCHSDNVFSVDLFVSPEMLHDPSGRPYYPMCLVMSDSDSGLSVHSTLLGGCPDMKRFSIRVADAFVDGIRKCGIRPESIVIRSSTLRRILDPVAGELAISLRRECSDTGGRRRPWPVQTDIPPFPH